MPAPTERDLACISARGMSAARIAAGSLSTTTGSGRPSTGLPTLTGPGRGAVGWGAGSAMR